MTNRHPLLFALLLAIAGLVQVSSANADKLVLKNGNTINGIVEKDGDKYIVEFPTGQMGIHKSEVKRVVREQTDLQRFRKRHDRIKAQDANAHYELGVWAKTRGLKKQARREFRHTIQLNPNHKAARKELGYIRSNGQWMTREEKMRREGYVKFEGEWVTPEVKQARIERRRKIQERNEQIEELRSQLRRSRNQIAQLENEISDLRQELQYERSRTSIRYYPVFTDPNRRDHREHRRNPHRDHWTRRDNGNTVITEQTARGEVWKEVLPNGEKRIIHRPGDGHSVHSGADSSKILKQHKNQNGQKDIELIHPKHQE